MSNHAGSYLLNATIKLMDKHEVFKKIGSEETLLLIADIINLRGGFDLNPGEILEKIGEKLGICYLCIKYSEQLTENFGVCKKCCP